MPSIDDPVNFDEDNEEPIVDSTDNTIANNNGTTNRNINQFFYLIKFSLYEINLFKNRFIPENTLFYSNFFGWIWPFYMEFNNSIPVNA